VLVRARNGSIDHLLRRVMREGVRVHDLPPNDPYSFGTPGLAKKLIQYASTHEIGAHG